MSRVSAVFRDRNTVIEVENKFYIATNSSYADNRIKVLCDALRLPTTDEVRGFSPEQDDVPFLCLLEDDSLITELKVTTDRLLTPPTGSSNHIGSDVHLVIHVKTAVVDRGREWQL